MRNNIASLDLIRIGLIFTVFMCHASYVLPEKIAYYAQGMTGYALELFLLFPVFYHIISINQKTHLKRYHLL